MYKRQLLLFVLPPSAATLKERLIGRGTEELSVIEARLKRAEKEAEGVEAYDYVPVSYTHLDVYKRQGACRASE